MRFPHGLALATAALLTTGAGLADPAAKPVSAPSIEPGSKVEPHLTARRIDIVDDNGVVRMTLAAPTPDPVIGGKAYKRTFPVAGLVLFDAKGDERGGFGVADIPGSAVVLALDHTNGDAVGWKVMPDGSVEFLMNARAPVSQDASGHTKPAMGTTRATLSVAADGRPALSLSDQSERPRVRVTVTPEGFGALEFLDKDGKVISTLAPEAKAK